MLTNANMISLSLGHLYECVCGKIKSWPRDKLNLSMIIKFAHQNLLAINLVIDLSLHLAFITWAQVVCFIFML